MRFDVAFATTPEIAGDFPTIDTGPPSSQT
jgi:hypothetical protein